jgi:exonuclease III
VLREVKTSLRLQFKQKLTSGFSRGLQNCVLSLITILVSSNACNSARPRPSSRLRLVEKNSPARREAVDDMVQSARPKLVCLQETKLAQISQQVAAETLGPGLDGFTYLPLNGTGGGGIMCAWRSDCVTNFNVTRHQFCLSLEVHLSWDQSSFWLTIVYGLVEGTDK